MNFIEHSFLWAKGEIFEGTIIAIAGASFLLIGLAFWKYGSTEGSRAFIIPVIIAGILFISAGIHSFYSNSNRIEEFKENFSISSTEFVLAEKKRVEGFQYLYKYTQWIAAIFFLTAIATQFLSVSPNIKAIGITLAIIGMAGLIIDYFSKERADIYYTEILKARNFTQGNN